MVRRNGRRHSEQKMKRHPPVLPTKEPWAWIEGTPYPLDPLRKFRPVANPPLIRRASPQTTLRERSRFNDAVRAFTPP